MKRALFALVAIVLATVACGGTPKPVVDPAKSDAAKRVLPTSAQAVVGHLLGSIGERTIGPFLARSVDGKGAMVGWITPAEGNARRVVAIPLTGVGEPRGPGKTVANVSVDATMLVVRPTRGASPGFALAWTVLTDRGEALWAVVLGDDGSPRGKPVELARTTDDVVWVDIVPTDMGAVCVWAEETRGGDANVLAAGLDNDGKVRGVPARLARGVAGWHALEIPGGVGVSTMTSASAGTSKAPPRPATAAPPPGPSPASTAAAAATAAGIAADSRGGTLAFQRLDPDGHPSGAAVPIVTSPTVSGDVEVVRAAGRLVFAWTDRTTENPSVAVAALADNGTVEPATRIVDARGGAALLGLAAGAAGTALIWEAPARRATESRRLHAARIGPALALEGRPTSMEIIGRATPELVATEAGFAILAALHDCDAGSPRCPDSPVVPTVVRTDAQLVPVQREAFGFGTDPASMAWGMTCDHDLCIVLTASGAAPVRIRAAEVRARENMKPPPDVVLASMDGPRVTDVTAVATGENITDLATTRIGDATILATLSMKPEPPGTKARGAIDDLRNAQLVLSTRVIDATGAVSPPVVLTTRALAVGGVAIAPASSPEDGGAVVWVARDNGDPEVHVTKIDKKGKKTNDVQLTTIKGDASDVAIAWAGGGWVVAWVDGRDGNGEVYATKVGADLSRNAGERITNAPGDASDLVALVVGDLVWLAWADPRESPKDGMADIFVGAVRTKDAKRAIDEQRVLATAAHSRTPQLAAAPDGVNVAWIEEAPLGVESPASSGFGAMWTTVGANGRPLTRPAKLPVGGEGAATSVTLERHPGGLRAVVARSMTDAIALDAMELSAAEPRAFPVLALDGPPSLDVALVLEGGALYFNDDGPTPADKRARRARIAWLP